MQALLLDLFGVFLGLAFGCCAFRPVRSCLSRVQSKPAQACIFTVTLCFTVGGSLGMLWCFMSPPLFSVLIDDPPDHFVNEPSRSVYFGQGCFWHTQYDMVVIEQDGSRPFGGRQDHEVTSLVGYAGGQYESPSGTACYHGFPATDYGRLGHSEAVSVELDNITGPVAQAQFQALAKFYFEHGFNTVSGGKRERHDPQDQGTEYRNVIGFPGGMQNAELWPIIQAANTFHMPLLQGKGANDGDDQDEYVVYIYDSNEYPFYRAEASHQFHTNDVVGRPVPDSYTRTLKDVQERLQRIGGEGCMDPPFQLLTPIIVICISFPLILSILILLTWIPEKFRWWDRMCCCCEVDEEEDESHAVEPASRRSLHSPAAPSQTRHSASGRKVPVSMTPLEP
mmetsp:Transcript_64361/g.119646  ORF Transcript_64361/g.119646 Transcript_64361/m.119646 type:complete len:394 (-) Transcript_64361:140-1321(-)